MNRHISICQLFKGPKSNYTQVEMIHPKPRSWFQKSILYPKNLGENDHFSARMGKFKVILEHTVPNSKEVCTD